MLFQLGNGATNVELTQLAAYVGEETESSQHCLWSCIHRGNVEAKFTDTSSQRRLWRGLMGGYPMAHNGLGIMVSPIQGIGPLHATGARNY